LHIPHVKVPCKRDPVLDGSGDEEKDDNGADPSGGRLAQSALGDLVLHRLSPADAAALLSADEQ
jgi:hypothetical protein